MAVAVSPKVGICPVNHLKQDQEELQKRIELVVDGAWAVAVDWRHESCDAWVGSWLSDGLRGGGARSIHPNQYRSDQAGAAQSRGNRRE